MKPTKPRIVADASSVKRSVCHQCSRLGSCTLRLTCNPIKPGSDLRSKPDIECLSNANNEPDYSSEQFDGLEMLPRHRQDELFQFRNGILGDLFTGEAADIKFGNGPVAWRSNRLETRRPIWRRDDRPLHVPYIFDNRVHRDFSLPSTKPAHGTTEIIRHTAGSASSNCARRVLRSAAPLVG